jgi:hypothetical protein
MQPAQTYQAKIKLRKENNNLILELSPEVEHYLGWAENDTVVVEFTHDSTGNDKDTVSLIVSNPDKPVDTDIL